MRGRTITTKLRLSHGFQRAAFSMTEMVFAIFILGVGLLFTSSMFPIAWTKARDVFEATSTESSAKASAGMFTRISKVNGPEDLMDPEPVSTFFPSDWFATFPGDPAGIRQPFVYPSTRVHAINLGNYLADSTALFATMEPDDLEGGAAEMPVGDNGWRLSDQLTFSMSDSLSVGALTAPPSFRDRAYVPQTKPHNRLFPPMKERPDATVPGNAASVALWDEQFASRRYCWSVLYRFSRLFGPDPIPVFDPADSFQIQYSLITPEERLANIRSAIAQPREVTAYYVTLKRPANARYARQQGLVGTGGTAAWNNGVHTDHPRAMAPETDVMMPSPWRFEASLLSPPNIGDTPNGIPSEIRVTDTVLANMLAPKTILIDDRNGQVYRITQRRETSDPDSVVLVLDKEYTVRDVRRAPYVPFPTTFADFEANWLSEWEWEKRNCDELDLTDTGIANVPECLTLVNAETNPERRYYWVFPPPVEAVRAAPGVPVFAGSPAVVEIKTRQVVLRPNR